MQLTVAVSRKQRKDRKLSREQTGFDYSSRARHTYHWSRTAWGYFKSIDDSYRAVILDRIVMICDISHSGWIVCRNVKDFW